MINWIDDNVELVICGGIIALLVLIFVMVAHSENSACRELMGMARTSHDSLEVAIRCKLGDGSSTTVVPVVVPIR